MDLTASWPSSSLDEDTAGASCDQVQHDHDRGQALTEPSDGCSTAAAASRLLSSPFEEHVTGGQPESILGKHAAPSLTTPLNSVNTQHPNSFMS